MNGGDVRGKIFLQDSCAYMTCVFTHKNRITSTTVKFIYQRRSKSVYYSILEPKKETNSFTTNKYDG